MSPLVYRIAALLTQLLCGVPVGTNLGLFHLLFALLSGRFLASRGAVFPALIATGCNIGPQRMAVASPGIGVWEINQIADFYFTEETLKAASIDLVNHATRLPLSHVWGQGDACSSDGMRFYVPVNVLAADYNGVLKDHGVTMLAHTANNYLQMHQKPIPCRLRESTFSLDGLMEHETELDPQICYTDTHGYTEVVMATASLLGFDLAPRIRDVKDLTLYKMDRTKKYAHLDPLLTGTIRPERIRQWGKPNIATLSRHVDNGYVVITTALVYVFSRSPKLLSDNGYYLKGIEDRACYLRRCNRQIT